MWQWKKRVETVEWKYLQQIDFEFTSKDTPQHNNLEELLFPYIPGIARAMLSAANIHVGTRGNVTIEAIKCAIQLDGLTIVKVEGKSQVRECTCKQHCQNGHLTQELLAKQE